MSEMERELAALRAAHGQVQGYLSRLFSTLAPQCRQDGNALTLCTQIDNYIAGLRAERDEAQTPHPFDKLPDSHAAHVEHWLTANQKQPNEVRWSLYPIGMVGRWVERAEAAESQRHYRADHPCRHDICLSRTESSALAAPEDAPKKPQITLDDCMFPDTPCTVCAEHYTPFRRDGKAVCIGCLQGKSAPEESHE